MSTQPIKRISRELTPEEAARIEKYRAAIAEELPDLVARNQLRKEAAEEKTLSGAIRRAIHSGGVEITTLAERAGITLIMLDEFLTGERTLRSDVLDKLAAALGFEIQATSTKK
jgi:plasmid maintenance system antidote protein VapI